MQDFIQLGRSISKGITVLYTDVTNSAKALERSHLCGPTAGLIQAQALAAVSLLGKEATQKDEAVTLRLRVDGPIGGLLVESNVEGDLRGYTNKKILNDFDGQENPNLNEVFGSQGTSEIIRSIPGKILDSAVNEIIPPTPLQALIMYYRFSNQRKVQIDLWAQSEEGYLKAARAILVECMPDGDETFFDSLEEKFNDGTIRHELELGTSIPEIAKILDLGETVLADPVPLRFACHCNPERVEAMLRGLPQEDLKGLVEKNESIHITCHLCGKDYEVPADRLQELLKDK